MVQLLVVTWSMNMMLQASGRRLLQSTMADPPEAESPQLIPTLPRPGQ
jgi:hypothetical protein